MPCPHLSLLLIALISMTPLPGVELPSVTCDVVVVGGGSAGICAAIASGRAGARTVLVEQASQVGGNTTTGGVNFPGLFHAWGKQIIAGIGWDLVERTVALAGDKLPDFTVPTGKNHWKHQIIVNVPIFVALAEEELVKAGVAIHYHAAPMTIEAQPDGWRVTTMAVGDRRTILCRQLVDCTGNGAVAGLLNLKRLREDERQPGSFFYQLQPNTDIGNLNQKDLQKRFEEAVRKGVVQHSDCRWPVLQFLKEGGGIGNYVEGADSSTADGRTDANLRGRASMLRMYRWLKTVPGLEGIGLVGMAPEVGIRETYRIEGEVVIAGDDYINERAWEDAVCHSFYPIDMHDEKKGVKPAHLKEGVVPSVPLRALIPKGSRNIMMAGRCLSADRTANSALRVQATCMATGQAAGVTAALAVKKNTTPGLVPLKEIRDLLGAQGAIVPD